MQKFDRSLWNALEKGTCVKFPTPKEVGAQVNAILTQYESVCAELDNLKKEANKIQNEKDMFIQEVQNSFQKWFIKR